MSVCFSWSRFLKADAFKQVNDQFGHRLGDHVLQEVASLLRAQMRRSDVCARYGGDEFLILLPGVDREGAEHAIERIQTAMENQVIDLDSGQPFLWEAASGRPLFRIRRLVSAHWWPWLTEPCIATSWLANTCKSRSPN